MTPGIFVDCVFSIKSNLLSSKEKKRLKDVISSNGGSFSYVLNEKCTHIIVNKASNLQSSLLKKIKKHQISVVDPDFIWKCIEENQLIEKESADDKSVDLMPEKTIKNLQNYQKILSYAKAEEKDKEDTHDCDFYDEVEEESSTPKDAEVAKYSFLQNDSEFAVVELLCIKDECLLPYKISTRIGLINGSNAEYTYFLADSSMKACEKYELRVKELENKGFLQKDSVPPQAMIFISEALQEVLLKEAIHTMKLSQEVGYFVESIWTDALGHLDEILSCPIYSISLNDVSKAEGILLQMKAGVATPRELWNLTSEFYRLIPHKNNSFQPITKKMVSDKQELCQLIRDILNAWETTRVGHMPSTFAKYQSLRCRIEHVDPNTEEYLQVAKQVLEKNYSTESFEILDVYRIGRPSEATSFQSKIGNVKLLLHSSAASNFLGILSRGLLLPKMVVEEFGLERTDIGNLGSGIYFTDSISACVKYSKPSNTSGARLLLLCDVALGSQQSVYKKDFSITEPPSGLHSVHGVRKTAGVHSDFEDDEFVVYNRNQVKMRYAVQFSTNNDKVDLQPEFLDLDLDQTPGDVLTAPTQSEDTPIDEFPKSKPIDGGLQSVDGKQMPLEMIHVKAKVMDLIAQVVIFQTYKNKSSIPIEAKYVFPLDSSAAVCGFEAFINGKHIVGEVKEKQQAQQEYRSAIREGHGAYLMDQDAPDVFTVSVGNLPPNSTVIIKITYITELEMSYSTVNFHIPGTVASWQKDKALNENTQDTVAKVTIDEGGAPKGCFCLDMSIEMPYKIEYISSYEHRLKIKQTDCKAVVQTKEGSSLGENGFTLVITMSDSYRPRMWVEKHPEKDSEACMLVFHPQFESEYQEAEATICLDCSNSMESCFQNAKLLALHALRSMNCMHLNLIIFGTTFKEFAICPKQQDNLEDLEKFIKMAKPDMGSTEFWKPLNSMCLLPPSSGIHKIILISDGHIQNEYPIFQILKRNVGKVRLFTCGVGATANRHMLRSLSQQSGGAFEYFEDKSKSSWDKKLERQISRMSSPACSTVSVKLRQFDRNAPEPLQAPSQIQSLFSQDSLLVYGFVRHCTQATLNALIDNKELETMVSTTELQKTTGTMLHKLTARALIRDYEDGILGEEEDEHELKKRLKKMLIIELSKEYSLVTQFTSFIAVEKREADERQLDIEPNIQEIIASEDVDFLPYMDWDTTDDLDSEVIKDEEDDFAIEYDSDSVHTYETYGIPAETDLITSMSFEPNICFAPSPAPSGTSLFSGQPDALAFGTYIPPETKFGSKKVCKQSICKEVPITVSQEEEGEITTDTSFFPRQPQAFLCGAKAALPPLFPPLSATAAPQNFQDTVLLGNMAPAGMLSPMQVPRVGFSAPLDRSMVFGRSEIQFLSMKKKSITEIASYLSPGESLGAQADGEHGFLTRRQTKHKRPSQPQTFSFGAKADLPPPPHSLFGSPFSPVRQYLHNALPHRNKLMQGASVDFSAPMDMNIEASVFGGSECYAKPLNLKKRTLPTWLSLSALQHEEGFWLLTPDLGKLLHIDIHFLTDDFLNKKGICSLGIRGKDEVQTLIATLLVLQAIRIYRLVDFITFKSLMKIEDSSSTCKFYPAINKAIKWAKKADQQYPGICLRLGLGRDWDSATKELLGIEPMNLASDLYPAIMA